LPSGWKVIDSHRRDAATVFLHHPCTVADDSYNAAVREKGRFSSTSQGFRKVINKGDDAHCDFRLDFRGAIGHCDLVQRNNVLPL
jgi:hypothetical protein